MRCRFRELTGPALARHLVGARRSASAERGSITAEFAIALPTVMVVLVLCLGGIAVAGAQIRVQDAAAAAARAAGRGDSVAVAAQVAPGASVSQWAQGDLVCVTVSATADLGPGGIPLSASSCALGGGK